jgi:hypothetical protein
MIALAVKFATEYIPEVPDPRMRAIPESFPLTANVGDILVDFWWGGDGRGRRGTG